MESGEERVGRRRFGRAAAFFAKTGQKHFVCHLREMRVGAGEVEGGERLGVGVVELADVGVEEESADLREKWGNGEIRPRRAGIGRRRRRKRNPRSRRGGSR